MNERRSTVEKAKSRGGCGFLIVSSIVTCIFLVLNGMIATRIYGWWAPFAPDTFKKPNVAQAFGLTLPVLLLFIEWWAFDLITSLIPQARPDPDDADRPRLRR